MPKPDFYRYFLASRPDFALRAKLVGLCAATGQEKKVVKADHLHLTWCVVAETLERDRFILPRVGAALAGRSLASGLLRLGRVRGGVGGAAVYSRGSKPEILSLYREIAACVTARGLPPQHRKSGFNPHLTIGYDRCAVEPFLILHEWIPDELLLVESEVGNGIHNILGRWPLVPPRQGELPFASACPPVPVQATGGWGRPKRPDSPRSAHFPG